MIVRILAVVLLAVVVPASAQQAPKKDDRLQAEQKRLLETERQLKEQREKAAEARRRETSLLAELEEIDARLATKQREVKQLDSRIRKAQDEVEGLRGEIRRLEGDRTTQQQSLARRLRVIYKVHAQGGALPLILSSDDPVARAATVRQLSRLAALDARIIREYRVTSDRLGDKRAREESRQEELAALRAEAKREQSEVDRDAAKRRSLLAKVRDERAYHERMVGELTEAARRLEAFIRDLQARQRRLAKVPPPKPGIETPGAGFGTLRGRLPWPTDGRVVATFGAQVHPRFGTRTFKNGVDIAAVEGTDVAAVYPGQVMYTGWFKGYGNLIILDHGNDYFTLYAHVADILVREGDDVKQGQRIGTVGDTGSLTGARLYFEVRYQGKPLDPEQWLRQRG
ncbi:MAG: peptidoglycan DD-metalloendopeptidase family protein [Candidatus Rokubacteria bacterium]|nr:peptidoglycan DD-metalloendopeptidase family protein [Candidatus Rokubacteria bacterium]